MEKVKQIKPTESELEILAVLWANESATVRTVHEELRKSRKYYWNIITSGADWKVHICEQVLLVDRKSVV